MKAFPYIKINVFAIRNDFFGETVTVSGLITGQDLKAQLLEKKASGTDLGDTLLITCNMLRSGEQVFLDDMTVQELEDALDMTLVAVENQGQELIEAMLNHHYTMQRDNDTDSFVYVKGYTHSTNENILSLAGLNFSDNTNKEKIPQLFQNLKAAVFFSIMPDLHES